MIAGEITRDRTDLDFIITVTDNSLVVGRYVLPWPEYNLTKAKRFLEEHLAKRRRAKEAFA